MVAVIEIVFLIVCVMVGVWWFRRTNTYRAYRRSRLEPGQSDSGARESLTKMPPKSGPDVGGQSG